MLSSGEMRCAPIVAVMILTRALFAAAGGGTVAIDAAGNIWLTGQSSTIATTPTAFQKSAVSAVCAMEDPSPFQGPSPVYCQHAYLIKQDATGNVLYATYLGGSNQDGATAITTDAQGNIYLAGYTYSSDFPVTAGAVQTKNAGPLTPTLLPEMEFPYGPTYVLPGGDAFVAKFSSSGALVFSTMLGGSGADVPSLIAVDASGNVYIAGTTTSHDFPLTADAFASQPAGYFLARLNATGTSLTYSTYSSPSILAFDVDSQGVVYLTGDFTPQLSPHTDNPYITIVDTTAGSVRNSTFLPNLNAKISGAGVAIALGGAQNLFLAVSPAPLPPALSAPRPPVRQLGASYLLELSADAGRILTETDLGGMQFDWLLVDRPGNAYAFGHGTGAIPATAIQPLTLPCSENGGSFVLESDPAGNVLAATYFRQGDDTAVSLTAPGHIAFYHVQSGVMTLDLSAPPAASFACPENLASSLVNMGIAPGEVFALTGVGMGPAQGITAAPDATGQFPKSLGGVQVLFGSVAAPLLYVQANEIHAVAPFSFAFQAVFPLIQVQVAGKTVASLEVAQYGEDAAIFSVNGQGAIVNQDGTVNTPANPAALGSIVSIYATGTGYLTDESRTQLNPLPDGQVTPIPPPLYVTQFYYPAVLFAGTQGATLFSGSAPGLIAGVTQINVQVPAALPAGTNLSAVPMVLDMAGTLSPPVFISLKQ